MICQIAGSQDNKDSFIKGNILAATESASILSHRRECSLEAIGERSSLAEDVADLLKQPPN